MKDSRVAKSFFEVGIILTLASMVLGPFDIVDWSISCCVVSCLLALSGMFFAFESWHEPVESEKTPEENFSQPQNVEKK